MAPAQVDTLHINSAHFQLRHMDSVTAFGALKVLRIERLAFVGAHMDDAAFALIGRLTHLEELALNVVLSSITEEGFLAGLESLQSLRYLELFSVRQVNLHNAVECLCTWIYLLFECCRQVLWMEGSQQVSGDCTACFVF